MTGVNSRLSGGLARIDLAVLGAVVATAVFVAVVILGAPCMVGTYQDDGVYLATAKALAEGKGYRHLELPGEPWQTKYPILYPLVLSVVWRFFPEFPGNAGVFQLVSIVLWAAGSWLAYRLMRGVWELPWWLPAAGVILAFANPGTLAMLERPMSEPLYMMLSMAALILVSPAKSGQRKGVAGRRGIGRVAWGGVVASAAYLTRSIGLALAVAAVAGLLLGRCWKHAVVAAALAAAVVAGWQGWCAYGAAANAANPAVGAYSFDLDYSAWFPRSAASVAWVVYHNVSALAVAYFNLLSPPSHAWVASTLQSGSGGALLLYLVLVVVSALTVLGMVAVWRRARCTTHLYLACYLGLVLIWPFPPFRFLIPIYPLLITLLLAGVWTLAALVVGTVTGGSTLRPARVPSDNWPGTPRGRLAGVWGSRAGMRATLVLAVVLGYQGVRFLVAPPGRPQLQKSLRDREALVELLRGRTPGDAVICGDDGGYLHLRTGRKFVPFRMLDNPVPLLYPDDRRFSACGLVITEGELAANMRLLDEDLVDYLRTSGATYLIPAKETVIEGAAFAEFRRRHPRHFRLVGSAGPFPLYQVLRHRW